jgi:hypothetical protein
MVSCILDDSVILGDSGFAMATAPEEDRSLAITDKGKDGSEEKTEGSVSLWTRSPYCEGSNKSTLVCLPNCINWPWVRCVAEGSRFRGGEVRTVFSCKLWLSKND